MGEEMDLRDDTINALREALGDAQDRINNLLDAVCGLDEVGVLAASVSDDAETTRAKKRAMRAIERNSARVSETPEDIPLDVHVTMHIEPPLWFSFRRGDRVRKKSGGSWHGRVVGFYRTDLTREGYAVESEREPGSVQIYPLAALEAVRDYRDTARIFAVIDWLNKCFGWLGHTKDEAKAHGVSIRHKVHNGVHTICPKGKDQ